MGCTGQARPKPGLTAGTALLTLGILGTDVLQHMSHIWPGLTSETVMGRADIATLCADNPADPGPPTAQDLAYTAILAAQAAGGGLGGAYGSWALKQAYYQVFINSCECVNVGDSIPPRITVPPPVGEPPFPPAHADQDILTRIEQNQSLDSNGLRTLYNGIMELNAQIGDMSWYTRPNFVGNGGQTVGTITGEGLLHLDQYAGSSNYLLGDMAGVRILVDQLPTVYKVRGTVVPRYYGIGSIMWLTSDYQSGVDSVSERVSIHYRNQFARMPREAFHTRIGFRLMPGASARIQVVTRGITGAWYGTQGWDERALLRMDQNTPPSGWTDTPFYPQSAEIRELPSGGGLPPAEFPCCS